MNSSPTRAGGLTGARQKINTPTKPCSVSECHGTMRYSASVVQAVGTALTSGWVCETHPEHIAWSTLPFDVEGTYWRDVLNGKPLLALEREYRHVQEALVLIDTFLAARLRTITDVDVQAMTEHARDRVAAQCQELQARLDVVRGLAALIAKEPQRPC